MKNLNEKRLSLCVRLTNVDIKISSWQNEILLSCQMDTEGNNKRDELDRHLISSNIFLLMIQHTQKKNKIKKFLLFAKKWFELSKGVIDGKVRWTQVKISHFITKLSDASVTN